MYTCNLIKKCPYINGTISEYKYYLDSFRNNFCNGYYKSCAIWNISNDLGPENVPSNLLPFQHSSFKKSFR